MPCFRPLRGYRSRDRNSSGKRSIVFTKSEGYADKEVVLPCGQCMDCRLKYSRAWAIRCVHEASLHDQNTFVTLTYEDEHLPALGSLKLSDFQKFMKRVRREFSDRKIKVFYCGEYGEHYKRPHFHACIFGLDWPDKELWYENRGIKYYRSAILESLWNLGFTSCGEVNFDTAAYVARYICKKIKGRDADEHYGIYDAEGRLVDYTTPEFANMSRRPGIAVEWFQKFKKDLFPDDFCVVDGQKFPVPKYYLDKFEIEHPDEVLRMKGRRQAKCKDHEEDLTWERLRVREEVMNRKLDLFKRGYEND